MRFDSRLVALVALVAGACTPVQAPGSTPATATSKSPAATRPSTAASTSALATALVVHADEGKDAELALIIP